jgi:hypothetical protein
MVHHEALTSIHCIVLSVKPVIVIVRYPSQAFDGGYGRPRIQLKTTLAFPPATLSATQVYSDVPGVAKLPT